jgi:uncharacterized protein YfaS (alpha-2-macroglobulin family)
VLALTGYHRPDPLEQLLGTREPTVTQTDSRDSLGLVARFGDVFGAGGLGLAGTGVGSGGSHHHPLLHSGEPRKDFTVTPYFNAHIVTANDGTVEVVVPVSEALTQYRLMAVAVTQAGESGSQEASVQTRRPLMIRASLPRLLRAGDQANIAALVMNETEQALHANVTWQGQGISTASPTTRIVAVQPHESVEVPFVLRAQLPGTAKVQLTVTSAGYRDSVVASLPVTLPMPLETVASYGQVAPRAMERLGDLSRARTDVGKLDVQLASSALVGLDRSLEQLVSSPYTCTEQLVSRILPDLLLRDLLRLYGVTRNDTTAETKAVLKLLLGRQQADGGFALWPLNKHSHPWVSVYTLLALREAIARGFDVPNKAFLEARNYAVRLLESADPLSLYAVGPFAAHVLNRSRALDGERLDRLWNSRRDFPFYAKAQLLEVLATYPAAAGANARIRSSRVKALRDELVSRVHFDGPSATVVTAGEIFAQCFDSPTRSAALLISALLEVEPQSTIVERLVRGLLSARKNGNWRSTQETTFALLALDKFRRIREAEVPQHQAKVWLNSQLLGQAAQQGHSLQVVNIPVPIGKLDPRNNLLEFTVEGEGRVYYETRLDYAPKQLPAVGLDRGFAVAGWLYRVTSNLSASDIRDGAVPAANEFQQGDVVTGRTRVTTPTARHFVTVEVLVPAGFELLNQELNTKFEVRQENELRQADAASHVDLRDDRVIYYIERMYPGTYDYQYLARATSAGRFQVPPAQAKEMYNPEVFGRTGASVVTVE